MAHLRSPEKIKERKNRYFYFIQREAVKQHLLNTSFNDPLRGEKVCVLTSNDIHEFLTQVFGEPVQYRMEILRGEVLVDSRGTGSLQTTIRR